MSGIGDKLDLLTLADTAELLHCSKAHVCKAVNGRVRGCVDSVRVAWPPSIDTPRKPPLLAGGERAHR